jgi:hypothetical protein
MPRPVKGERTPGSGRKPGQSNHLTGALKDLILKALADAGGSDYLLEQSKANPTAFMALVGRVLPLQVKDGGRDPQMPKQVVHEHLAS